MVFGGLANGGRRESAARKKTVLACLGRAKSALYEAHTLTRTGGDDAITCIDSPYWEIFCEVEALWLAEKHRLDEPRRAYDELLTNEYGPAFK